MTHQQLTHSLQRQAIRDTVARIWCEVLAAPNASEHTTFLALNGQSILAVRLVTVIEEELGLWVDVDILFDDPSLAEFTDAVLECAGRPHQD